MNIRRLTAVFPLLITFVSGTAEDSMDGLRTAPVLQIHGLAKKGAVLRKLCGKAGGKSSAAGKSSGKVARREDFEDVCDDNYDSVDDWVRTYPPIANAEGASGDTFTSGDDMTTLDDFDMVEPEPVGHLTGANSGGDGTVAEDDDSINYHGTDDQSTQDDGFGGDGSDDDTYDGSVDDDASISNDVGFLDDDAEV